MQTEDNDRRIQGAKPVGQLFDVFLKFAEKKFSGGTSLKHIEVANIPEARGLDWTRVDRDPDRIDRRRAHERPKLISGLAVYLFDRFIRDEQGHAQNVFLRLACKDNFALGTQAFTSLSEQDCGRIDFRNHPNTVRGRLIEIAESQSCRYPFIDTRLWEITRNTRWRNSLYDEELSLAFEVWDEIGAHTGAALYFVGKLPEERQIEGMMGSAVRFSDEHIRELVDEIHQMTTTTPLEQFYQDRVAFRIGVEKNTRTFSKKIWPKFRLELTDDQRNRLPKRGRAAKPK